MKKYKLVIPGITEEYDNVVKGFVAAEERAQELLDEFQHNYPDCYVACFEENETMYNNDFLIFTQDCYGDRYWKIMVMGDWMPVYDRLLKPVEKDYLEELRNDTERHISDLTKKELKILRSEICIGSLFLSDYENSFNIDADEVCDVCDDYEEYLHTDENGVELPENKWKKDTQEEFVNYCMNY